LDGVNTLELISLFCIQTKLIHKSCMEEVELMMDTQHMGLFLLSKHYKIKEFLTLVVF